MCMTSPTAARTENFPSPGAWIRYDYDPAKPESIVTSEGDVTDFTYYPCGSKVDTVSRNNEGIRYLYDGSLVTSEILSGTLSQTLSYVYNNDPDGDHDLVSDGLTYAGSMESYAYDDDGLLIGSGRFSIARNADNGLPESVSDSALESTRTFSLYGETDTESFSAGGTGLFSCSVIRDKNGRITQKTETFGDGTTATYLYDYDAVGRLLTVTKDGVVAESYQYDTRPYGIRTYQETDGVGRSLSYNDEDNLLTAGGVSYQHDADGPLVSKTQERTSRRMIIPSVASCSVSLCIRTLLMRRSLNMFTTRSAGALRKRWIALSPRSICGRG